MPPLCFFRQQFLNFFPLPQGQGSFRPTGGRSRRIGCGPEDPLLKSSANLRQLNLQSLVFSYLRMLTLNDTKGPGSMSTRSVPAESHCWPIYEYRLNE